MGELRKSYPDYQRVIVEAEMAGIDTIAVTTTPSVFARCVEISASYRHIYPAIGLHPEWAGQRARELPLLISSLAATRFVGEIGLDYTTQDLEDRRLQRDVFAGILDACAGYGNKVLTIHSRRAETEIIQMVGDKYPGAIILHWFTGSHATLNCALSAGYYISVNPAMIASARGRAIVSEIPRNRILMETDGPFVMVDRRPARPSDITRAAAGLAREWSMSNRQALSTLNDTAQLVFGDYL